MYATRKRRNTNFTIGECIKCINCFIRGNSCGQMNENLYVFRSVVLNLLDFNFPFFVGLQHRIDETLCCCTEWDFGND